MKNKSYFFSLNSLFLIFGICLIGLLLVHFDPQKNWSVKIMQRFNGFLSLKVNILSIQSVLFSWYAITARAPITFVNFFYGIHY